MDYSTHILFDRIDRCMEKLVENKRLLSKEKIKVSFLNQYLTNNLYFAGLVIFCCIGFLAVYILDDFGDYIDILTSVISTKFIVKYMYLVFLVITNLVGVFIIENTDIYLYELRAQSEDYNSLWVLSWVHFIFIVCLYIFDNVFDNKFVNKMSKDKERWIYKGKDIGDIIFEFTGAIENRNIKKAYNLWPKMKYTGDGTMRVISVLYNSFRQILMVQSTPPKDRTEKILGMTNGQIYITAQKCNKYNIYEVVNIVKTLRYLEKGIKIGTVAEEFAMDYLMGTIW